MKRHVKKTAAWALALCLTLGMLPCAALAEEPTEEEEKVEVTETVEAPVEVPEVPEETETAPETPEELPEAAPEEAEEEPVPEPKPVYSIEMFPALQFETADSSEVGIIPLAGNTWVSGKNNSYGDQLDQYGKKIYAALEKAFDENDKTAEVVYTDVLIGTDGDGKETKDFIATYLCENIETGILEGEIDSDEALGRVFNEWFENIAPHYTKDVIISAMYAFTYDHPEYFWIRTDVASEISGSAEYVEDKGCYQAGMSITLTYNIDKQYLAKEAREEKRSAVEEQVRLILNACKDMPTVAQLAYFDNWLAEKNVYNDAAGKVGSDGYDPEYAKNKPDGVAPWNITSAFIDTLSPVCEGYAKSFKVLCDRINVPCITVSSNTHMWNMVLLDNAWYFVDCTWDDTDTYSNRNHFLTIAFAADDEDHQVPAETVYPEPSDKKYFNDEKTVWYADVNSGTSSGGDNTYWIAGYESKGGKMVGLEDAYSFYWTGTGSTSKDRLIFPDADASESNASYKKLFTVETANQTYKPVEAARELPSKAQ